MAGQFGTAIGGGSALIEAMQRRGMSTGALQQQSPGSAGGGTPMPQPPSELQSAQMAIPQEMPQEQQAPTTGVTQPTPSTDPELSIALEALGGFVKSGGQTRRDLVKGKLQGMI